MAGICWLAVPLWWRDLHDDEPPFRRLAEKAKTLDLNTFIARPAYT